jgi:hypothetical protein
MKECFEQIEKKKPPWWGRRGSVAVVYVTGEGFRGRSDLEASFVEFGVA